MENNYGFIKFFGPSVDEGSIDIAKAGKVFVATDKIFQKYIKLLQDQGKLEKLEKGHKISLKTGNIVNNCTKVELSVEILGVLNQIVSSSPVETLTRLQVGKTVFEKVGLQEFCSKFMGRLGELYAEKIFSKGKSLSAIPGGISDGDTQVILKNEFGESKAFSFESWLLYQTVMNDLNQAFALEKGKEEKMEVGYISNTKADIATGSLTYNDKEYFSDSYFYDLDSKLSEPFEEEKSFQQTIVGRFVDFYGLAHKYHFSFQARKNQNKIGKHKILCMVDSANLSKIIDYLKPENDMNITILGKATKDNDGKIDKIKVERISGKEDSLFEI